MDAPAPRTRHLVHRARLQSPGRRAARRLRSAAVLLLIGACSKEETPAPEKPKQDYHARFLEARWDGIESFDAEGLVEGLTRYIRQPDDTVYPQSDRRNRALHEYLYRARPDPAGLLPLLGPRPPAEEVDERVMRRDLVAYVVVTTFYRRLVRDPDDAYTAALWDAVAHAAIHFGFDPLYGDAHTMTGAEVGDLFMDGQLSACEASRAAVERNLEPLLQAWRKRVTQKASTTMFAITMRHMGAAGADRLFGEWARMSGTERYNLLKLAGDQEGLSATTRSRIVEALLAPAMDLREAALEALGSLGAPVEQIEIAAPEAELARDLAPLRQWAAKTDS